MSHVFEVEMPDKSILEIEAPENTPPAAIRQRAMQHFTETAPANQPAYKKETARQQFDANQAHSAGTQAGDLLDRVKAVFRKPDVSWDSSIHSTLLQQPGIIDSIKGVAGGLGDLVTGPSRVIHAAQTGNPREAVDATSNFITNGIPAAGMVEGLGNTMPTAALEGASKLTSPDALYNRAKALLEKINTTQSSAVPLSKFAVAKTAVKGAVDATREPRAAAYVKMGREMENLPSVKAQRSTAESSYQRQLGARDEAVTTPRTFNDAPVTDNPRPTTPSFVEDQLTASRAQETPQQAYERAAARREIDNTYINEPRLGDDSVANLGTNPYPRNSGIDNQLSVMRATETPQQLYDRQRIMQDEQAALGRATLPEQAIPYEGPQPGVHPNDQAFLSGVRANESANILNNIPTPNTIPERYSGPGWEGPQEQTFSEPYNGGQLADQRRSSILEEAANEGQRLREAEQLRNFGHGADPAVANVEEGIGPTGTESRASTLRNAQELSKDPLLATAKGLRFDQLLHNKFINGQAMVEAASKNIPPSTPVMRPALVDGLEKVALKYIDSPEAFKAVTDEIARWDTQDILTWDRFEPGKRAFGDRLSQRGRFKDSGNVADAITTDALKEAYRVFMDVSAGTGGDLGKALKAANHEYHISIEGIVDAGMDPKTGRRYKNVGKPAPSIADIAAEQERLTKAKALR